MKTWIYKHYKNKYYEVIWIAKDSETLKDFVVYKALYDSKEFWNNALWIRPKSMFVEKVLINWKEIARFTYVWKAKDS